MPIEDEKEETLALYERAIKAGEIEAANKLSADNRALTLKDMTEAGCCLERGEDVSEHIRKKLEKDDVRLYAVDIGRTVVASGNRTGVVAKVEMVGGYNELTVQWSGGNKVSKHSLEDILQMARKDQGVVPLEVAKEKVNFFSSLYKTWSTSRCMK